jgi:hypothetical protein
MNKSLAGHALVAGFLAILAYVAWTSPKEKGDETVVMVPGTSNELTGVRWQEQRWDVEAKRKGEGWDVTVQKLNPKPVEKPADDAAAPAPDAAASPDSKAKTEPGASEPSKAEPAKAEPAKAASPAAVARPEPPLPPAEPARTFPGSDKIKELVESLAPLKAARTLGNIPVGRLAALGLEKPQSKLTLRFGERQVVVEIGDATFGSGDLYAKTADGEVYLIANVTLGSIRHGATALLDKDAVGAKREKVERLTITTGATGRELVQRFGDDKDKRFFADPAEPDAKLELVDNWLERMWRLRVVDLVETVPQGAPALEVELFDKEKTLDLIKLWPPDEKVSLATSQRFGQAFTVSKASAETLLKDVQSVLDDGK